MAKWNNPLLKSDSALEDKWDELRFNFIKKFGLNDPVQIVP
jgi:hypothetical protein